MPRISPAAQRAYVEQRRAQILTAAAHVFAAKGFERATIAEIARHAGIAEGSIYNYFKNKGDLLISIPRQIVQPPLESLSAEFAQARAPEQMLALMARTLLTTMHRNAHLFRVLISALPAMKPAARAKYAEQVVTYVIGILEAYFREQIARGSLRANLDVPIATRAFVGMFFPFILLREVLQLEDIEQYEDDAIIAQAVAIFLRGALSREHGHRRVKVGRAKKGKTK